MWPKPTRGLRCQVFAWVAKSTRGAWRIPKVAFLIVVLALPVHAQARPITRGEAIDAALSRGARLAIAAADTAVSRGQLLSARSFPNPALTASYTEDTPRYHVEWEVPIDYGALRSARIKAADASRLAALYRFRLELAASALDADTLYTLAQARQAHLQLSRRNALDADSLVRIALARRDAGDASDLDVEVARLFAGDQRNAAADDSLAFFGSILSLQAVMGLPADSIHIVLTDSLAAPDGGSVPFRTGRSLPVAAAQATMEAAELIARMERRNRWVAPGVILGFETRDPGGAGNRILPVIGLSLPVPLFNRNTGPIAVADAERDRARAQLALAQVETEAGVTRILRERDLAFGRVERNRALVTSAERVAAMSLAAFREGAAPLASVLDAQRTARDILGRSVDDVARARIAAATATVLTLIAPDRP